MALRIEASTAFWSLLRASEVGFFCISPTPNQYQFSPGYFPEWVGKTNLGLLSTIVELFLLGLFGLLLTREVLLIEFLHIDTSQVDRGRGCDDVPGIYATQGNPVDLKGTCDKKDTISEAFKINDTLPTESAGKDDQDRAGNEGRAEDSGSDGFADLQEVSIIDPKSNLIPRSKKIPQRDNQQSLPT